MNHLTRLWKKIRYYYRQKSIQFTLSISFTLVTVIGMALLGVSLLHSYQSAMEHRPGKH